jgi:hypothetical protein
MYTPGAVWTIDGTAIEGRVVGKFDLTGSRPPRCLVILSRSHTRSINRLCTTLIQFVDCKLNIQLNVGIVYDLDVQSRLNSNTP